MALPVNINGVRMKITERYILIVDNLSVLFDFVIDHLIILYLIQSYQSIPL